MADKSASPAPEVVAPAKAEAVKKATAAKSAKAKAPKAPKAPKALKTHPSTSDMVKAAVKDLAERNGSSLQAIKKYMAANYKLDTEKHALFIKKYLKSAVTSGDLIQTKGKGASGSFKLAALKKAVKTETKPAIVKKPTSPKKVKAVKKPAAAAAAKKAETTKAIAKKIAAPKKVAAAKNPVAEKKTTAVAKVVKPKASKSPKAKKATKAPTAKPKSPKPKKAVAPKKTAKAAPKKVASKK